MADEPTGRSQLSLFEEAPLAPPWHQRSPRLEQAHAEAATLAAGLPDGVRLGTSSWGFPDWEGIVYSSRRSVRNLSREGLREYAQHPLLSTVGIDRGYYGPIPRSDLERYAAQLPPGFPCCAKAPEAVTSPVLRDRSRGRTANPDFLRPDRFLEEMIGPFTEAFREHAGPFVIQFPPAPAEHRLRAEEFAERLDRFLAPLPRSLQYAVEMRDPSLLTEAYARVLSAHGAAHTYNYVTAMPTPEEQRVLLPSVFAPFTMIRLVMPPGTRYAQRRDALSPFDRLSDPDPAMRRQVVRLVRDSAAAGRFVYVLVNNKAEGCAPLTIRALAELLAEREG